MRGTLLAALIAAGVSLAGVPSASAAPIINGASLSDAITGMQPVETVQHRRWGSGRGGHWRWGSGGHWRWGSRGRYRWWRRR
jgi:hypothetical protein